jgi:type II secretory pathway pseudopilin PulG
MATTMREMSMRVPRWPFAWTAAVALSAGSSSTLAAEPGPDTLPINVIAIQTNDADDQAEALTKALRVAVRLVPGWSLGEGDYSLEVLTLSLKCPEPPDANCQSRIADQIKSDRYVWGTLKKKGDRVSGEVHLWVRAKGTSNWPLEYTSNLTEANDDALKKIAGEAIAQLTGGPPKAGIHVRVGSAAGQVFVDGEPVGALKDGEGTFMVLSGPHKVTVKAVGYADMESQVVVKPNGTPTEVSLALVPVSDTTPLNGKRIGGFSAIGVGVVFGIVGIAAAAKVNSVQGTVNIARAGMASSTDVCSSGFISGYTAGKITGSQLSDACSTGKTFQTLQIVSFPLAAIAGGVGIFLVATSNKPAHRTSGFSVDPQIGPGTGKLDLSYTW